ncbi:UDP-galactose transporter [Pseudozyma hubeiensis SY62]|uniref:UDP-galactose transporter n=1 Tax=Pseudozyma hubeiensis (strain SY62) TaxID=1305764 RepID=R9P0T9_PSEHS|nr:UDP-galactose transporter [Pseudozyma hubeiensis SY62]GAC94749.1 UDP-galactose transporter [Pseudozyma hubeiensis SY62]
MFGSLTPLILGISGLKSSTGIVFHQASKHAAYSPSLTVLLCESIKIVASFLLLTRALHRQRNQLHPSKQASNTSSTGYTRLQAEDFEVQDTAYDGGFVNANKEASASMLERGDDRDIAFHQTLLQLVRSQVFQIQGFRLIVPALIYVVQNNLYLYAASELDPAFFQALWQMRILMSATLSWAVLKKRILPVQWLCILGIFVGVMLVKTATMPSSSASLAPGGSSKTLTASLALCAAAALSSTAGVILEFIFRDRSVNLWASNVQLSCFSILPAACIVFFRDASHLGPVLHDLHTSPWPMGVVFCQSFNGMMIAILLKKAGVIINDFTSAVSIVLTFALNEMLFPASSKIDSVMDVALVVAGSAVILGCSTLYHRHLPKEPKADQVFAPVDTRQNALHLNLDAENTSYSASVSSSSTSSPTPSSIATPLPRSPMGHYFNLSTDDLRKGTKPGDVSADLLELQQFNPHKCAP